MTGVVAGVVTVEMSVGGGGIMTWYRDSLAVYVDGRRLAGGELAEFAGLGYYADYQARMSPDRSLPVLVGGHNKDRLCVRGGFAALVALAASYGAGDGGWARQKHHRWLPVGHPDLPAKTKAQTPCDGKGSCEVCPARGSTGSSKRSGPRCRGFSKRCPSSCVASPTPPPGPALEDPGGGRLARRHRQPSRWAP